jgi:hypothetical protein
MDQHKDKKVKLEPTTAAAAAAPTIIVEPSAQIEFMRERGRLYTAKIKQQRATGVQAMTDGNSSKCLARTRWQAQQQKLRDAIAARAVKD